MLIRDISVTEAHDVILNILGNRKVIAKWVPRLLSNEQKEQRFSICEQWKNRLNENIIMIQNGNTDEKAHFRQKGDYLRSTCC